MSGITGQGYDYEVRGSYFLRYWTRLSTMAASRAVAPQLPWKDRNHSSTRCSPNRPWHYWQGCFATANSAITAASSIWQQGRPRCSRSTRSAGNEREDSASAVRRFIRTDGSTARMITDGPAEWVGKQQAVRTTECWRPSACDCGGHRAWK